MNDPISPEDMLAACRTFWRLQGTLKCSRCQRALDGECKPGDARRAAKATGRPCFSPNPRQLKETLELLHAIREMMH